MTAQEQIKSLLQQWITSTKTGKPIPLAELCKDCPDLLPEVEQHIKQVIADSTEAPSQPVGEATFLQGEPPSFAPPSSENYPSELGGYQLTKVLGEGGMGRVYLADDTRLSRKIAIKVMKPEVAMNSKNRERFLREAKATAALEHDHIITIFQVGEEKQIPFLVMPLLKGEPLDARLKRDGKLPLQEVLRIGREIAEGLAAAHEQGLIHRDIKPSNIWLDGARGRVKILDFGLAKVDTATEGEGLTQSGAVMGTPAYMAPEQARGLAVDHRADLFSMGCILYQMLTGKRAFTGADTLSILTSLAIDTPTEPDKLDPLCPKELSQLTMQLLAKQPDQRPSTANAVAESLTKIEAGLSNSTQTVAPLLVPRAGVEDRTAITSEKQSLPPKPQVGSGKSKTPLFIAIGIVALIPLIWFLSTVILRVETENGTLVVEMNDPEVEAKIKDGKLILSGSDGKDRYTISPAEKSKSLEVGEYKIRVEGADGLVLNTKEFTLKKGDKVTVRVSLEAKVVAKNPDPIVPKNATESFALKFEGIGSYVGFADLRYDESKPITVEMWVLNEPSDIRLFVKGKSKSLIFFRTDLGWRLGQLDGVVGPIKLIALPNPRGKWMHLAGVIEAGTVKIYLDGKPVLAEAGAITHPHATIWESHLGTMTARKRDQPEPIAGTVRGLHLSQSVRYTKEFTPPTRFEKDKDTIALYQFDEGQGEVLKDSSGNGRAGKIVNSKWIKSEEIAVESIAPDRKAAEYVLKLGGNVQLNDLEKEYRAIAELPKEPFQLTVITLSQNKQVSDSGLAVFKDCQHLKEIHLDETATGDVGISYFKDSPNLRLLGLNSTRVGDAGLLHFKDHKQIAALNLGVTRVTDAGLLAFADLRSLASLNLSKTAVTNKGMSAFKDSKNLMNLYLNDTKLDDAGLINFKGCKDLLGLVLYNTATTDEGFAHFKESNKLGLLWLDQTKITDASVPILKEFKKLTSLGLRETKVTSTKVEELKKALPICKIEGEGAKGEPKK